MAEHEVDDGLRERIAAAVRLHALDRDEERSMYVCICGADLPLDGRRVPFSDHLADLMLPLIAEHTTEVVRVERAALERVRALADLGVHEQWPPDEWRAGLHAALATEERP